MAYQGAQLNSHVEVVEELVGTNYNLRCRAGYYRSGYLKILVPTKYFMNWLEC